MLTHLRPAGSPLTNLATWPDLEDCQRILDAAAAAPILCGSGLPLRVTAQGGAPHHFGEQYEPRIYLAGELQTRTRNWHDLFNLLAWATFPLAKAAINARHVQAAQGRPRDMRGPIRDMLTLFDECGVVVASADAQLEQLLQDFRWRDLFWLRRTDVRERMRFYLFGHALCEKALRPYVGMTGKGIVLKVESAFFEQEPGEQLSGLDQKLAALFRNPAARLHPRRLQPIPVLGVPGWAPENERETYYANSRYFRPGRASSGPPAR